MAWRPRLRSILLIVNLLILLLPLGGIFVLRIYESALVRQTESELIAQAAFVAASYKATFQRHATSKISLSDYGLRPLPQWRPPPSDVSRWRPRPAILDLADAHIRPRPEDPLASTQAPDAIASKVGQELRTIIQDAQVVTLASIRVVDYQGIVVASTAEEAQLSLLQLEEIQRALQGEHVSLLRRRISDEPAPPLLSMSRGTHVRVFVSMPIFLHDRILGAVMLSRTPASIGQALYHKRYLLISAALLLLAVVLMIAGFVSYTINQPLRALMQQTERAVRGEKGAITPLSRPVTSEIAQLSKAVAHMAYTLERRADYISDFAAQVSHEFKTPLTAIRGAAELLRDHGANMSDEERERFWHNLLGDTERLDALVKHLLELARADVLQVGEESCDAATVVANLMQRYQHTAIELVWQNSKQTIILAISENILETILINLIENARQHAGETVRIDIDMQVESDSQQLRLRLTDNGPGISAGNALRVFEPFFTTARESGGTGLGLAVIKSLIEAHQGSIRLDAGQEGASFKLTIPLRANTEASLRLARGATI